MRWCNDIPWGPALHWLGHIDTCDAKLHHHPAAVAHLRGLEPHENHWKVDQWKGTGVRFTCLYKKKWEDLIKKISKIWFSMVFMKIYDEDPLSGILIHLTVLHHWLACTTSFSHPLVELLGAFWFWSILNTQGRWWLLVSHQTPTKNTNNVSKKLQSCPSYWHVMTSIG